LGIAIRKKESAKLTWNTKPHHLINIKGTEIQTSEIVFSNPTLCQPSTTQTFFNSNSNIKFQRDRINRIICGNNILTMQALIASGYEGKISLIYADPPFWTNENYYAKFEVGDTESSKVLSIIQRLAYSDSWKEGIDSFLDMLYPRLQLMKRLLTNDGSIFLHLDYHISHYTKLIMDEIFGIGNFRNEIIVKRGRKKGLIYQFDKIDRMHTSNDTILWYTKCPSSKFKQPLSETEKVEAKWMGFWSNIERPTMRYEIFGVTPNRGQWKWKRERALRAIENYRKFEDEFNIHISSHNSQITKDELEIMKNKSLLEYWRSNGQILEFIRKREGVKYPEYWVEPREHKIVDNLWTDIQGYNYSSNYPTEKHAELLERIITNFSDQGDLIADFFAGSGTTLAVAEKNERQWIGCDFSKVAIQIIRNRLVQNSSRPFLIENIGNCQRQSIYLTGSRIYDIQPIILKLYGAIPRKDFPNIGIRRDGLLEELVYISYPDIPVTAKKVEELETLAEHLDGRGYQKLVILGWSYECNYDHMLEARKRTSNREWHSRIVNKAIPPEIYEYLNKAEGIDYLYSLNGKIRFYDKPYLRLMEPEIQQIDRKFQVTVGIDKYIVFDFPLECEQQQKRVQEILADKPLSLIDYWAIDWNYDGTIFKSCWQAMRRVGRRIQSVPKYTSMEFESAILCTIAIKVVDIFGNETTGTVNMDLTKISTNITTNEHRNTFN
jgi:adenine-specific DNA-methyltransferase